MNNNYLKQVYIARDLFGAYDQEKMIRKFALNADAQYLYLSYLGRNCRIDRTSGQIDREENGGWTEELNFQAVMTICDMLCFSDRDEAPQLTGRWKGICGFQMAGASPNTTAFTGKYAAAWDGKTGALKAACLRLGGEVLPSLAGADLTCRLNAFSFFPVLLQFWEGDEEFVPKLDILLDESASEWMHFETFYYLQGNLMELLEEKMQQEPAGCEP